MADATTTVQTALTERQEKLAVFNIKKQRVSDLLAGYKSQIAQALPRFMTADVMIRTALTATIRRPELLDCTGHSLISCVLTASQLGLRPDDFLGEAYLIPFNNNKKQVKECQIIVGYKGLVTLAMRSGEVASCKAVAVYGANEPDGDYFDYDEGLNEKLEHKSVGLDDPDRITHFYAIVRFKGGGQVFKVMTRKKVEGVRDKSKNYIHAKIKSETVWATNFEEMGCKTVLRRVMKFVPLSPELARAVALDEAADLGKQNPGIELINETPELADDVIGEIIQEEEQEQQENRTDKAQKEKTRRSERSEAVTSATADLINKKVKAKSGKQPTADR